MQVEFYGVRGSLPTPLGNREYTKKVKRILEQAVDTQLDKKENIDSFLEKLPENLRYNYGGNTTCVAVRSAKGNLYILDMGTGLRQLGVELMNGDCALGKGKIHIFLSHTHWDHIQAAPFFYPVYVPGNEINFYSPVADLQERIEYQQKDFRFFPATFEGTASTKNYYQLKEGEILQLEDDFTVDFCRLKHPGGCFSYRFRENGKTFIFATDAEFTGESLEQMSDNSDYFMNADLLVLDSQYTLDDAFSKFDWGHTSNTMAVNCGIRWNVQNLVLTHHEPAYDDDFLMNNLEEAIAHRNSCREKLPNIFLGREGLKFDL